MNHANAGTITDIVVMGVAVVLDGSAVLLEEFAI
jgi:hypothetical protein